MALSHAVYELADNVVQHSGETIRTPARGVVAYYSTPTTFGWVVADRGRGALTSLRTNPDWSGLLDDTEALMAIISRSASSRPGMGFGNGYRDLFRALIDRAATVELWTGTSIIQLALQGETRMEEILTAEHHSGFILKVEIQNKN